MALFAAMTGFSGDACVTAALGGTTASGNLVLGKGVYFALRATGDFNVFFENSGGGPTRAAAATDFQLVGNTVYLLQMGDHSDTLKLFNPGAGSITYWIQILDTH